MTHSGEGEGLLFYGNIILPFIDRFPKDTELYRIMTTKLQELKEGSNHDCTENQTQSPAVLQRAMEIQRRQLLLAMADAVSECRTAERMAAELNGDGETGPAPPCGNLVLPLPDTGGRVLEGRGAELLADVLAQVYACLVLRPYTPRLAWASMWNCSI